MGRDHDPDLPADVVEPHHSEKEISQAITAQAGPTDVIAVEGSVEYSPALPFYTGRRVLLVNGAVGYFSFASKLPEADGVFIVLRTIGSDHAQLTPDLDRDTRAEGSSASWALPAFCSGYVAFFASFLAVRLRWCVVLKWRPRWRGSANRRLHLGQRSRLVRRAPVPSRCSSRRIRRSRSPMSCCCSRVSFLSDLMNVPTLAMGPLQDQYTDRSRKDIQSPGSSEPKSNGPESRGLRVRSAAHLFLLLAAQSVSQRLSDTSSSVTPCIPPGRRLKSAVL